MFQGDSGLSEGTVPGRDGGKVEAALRRDGPSAEEIRARSSEPEGLV